MAVVNNLWVLGWLPAYGRRQYRVALSIGDSNAAELDQRRTGRHRLYRGSKRRDFVALPVTVFSQASSGTSRGAGNAWFIRPARREDSIAAAARHGPDAAEGRGYGASGVRTRSR